MIPSDIQRNDGREERCTGGMAGYLTKGNDGISKTAESILVLKKMS